MSEIAAIHRAWTKAARASEPTWLATIISLEGFLYRRPGARLLFSRELILAGAVSGGRVDRELVRTGPWLTRNGPVQKAFDSRSGEEGEARSGSQVHGKIQVLLEPLTASSDGALGVIGRELEAERRVALATIIAGPARLGARVVVTESSRITQLADLELTRELAAAAKHALATPYFRPQTYERGATRALLEVLEPPPRND